MNNNADTRKEVSIINVILTLLLGCVISGLAIYLVRVVLWGKLILEVIYWFNSLSISKLLFIVFLLPVGGLLIWIGMVLPITLISSLVLSISSKINSKNQKAMKICLAGIGIFNIIGAAGGIITWIYILIYNSLDAFIVIGFICAIIQLITGITIFKGKEELTDIIVQDSNVSPNMPETSTLSEVDFSSPPEPEIESSDTICSDSEAKKIAVANMFIEYKKRKQNEDIENSIGKINPYTGKTIQTTEDYMQYMNSFYEEGYKKYKGQINPATDEEIKTIDDFITYLDFARFGSFMQENPSLFDDSNND